MYELEYLPVARKDILDIARYIIQDLNNPSVAAELITTIAENLKTNGITLHHSFI